MKLSLSMDHGALALRAPILDELAKMGHEVVDYGTKSSDSVDYPDFAERVCLDVQNGESDFGILCCTTAIGMSMAANKYKGIRAAVVHFEDHAILTRQHNNANILCLGAMHTSDYEARLFVRRFLETKFEGGRHERRICKFNDVE